MDRLKRLRWGRLTAAFAAVSLAVCLTANAMAAGVAFEIAAGDATTALKQFAVQAHVQLLFDYKAVGKLRTPELKGQYEPGDALKILLRGTGFTFRQVNDHTIAVMAPGAVVMPTASPSSQSSTQNAGEMQKEGESDSSGSLRVAQAASEQASAPSSAEVANPKTPTERAERLQEVIVTAEKREMTAQHTPISLTAVSGAEIQERGLVDLLELGQSLPGVSMRTSGPGQTEFEMRGMAATGGNSATVGFYLDDAPITAPSSIATNGHVVIDPNLYDLNRIEVLRGPQGTLYGSGSMGGTIKIVTNAPNPAAFAASAELIPSYTDGGSFNHGENAMVNIPFGNGTAALRIVGSESHTSGWIDRIVIANGDFPLATNPNGTVVPFGTVRGNVLAAPVAEAFKGVNVADLEAVRGSLLWAPTDRFSINASWFYQHISQDGATAFDSNPGTDAHYQPFDSPEPFSDNFNLGNLSFRYRFDSFDLSSTTSRWIRNEAYSQDGSEQWQWALGLPSYYTSQGGIGPLSPTPVEIDESKQISEELRLTSSGTGDFQWLIGYYYGDLRSDAIDLYNAPGAVPLFGISNIGMFSVPTAIIQQSFFGELSYRLTPRLTATAGLRRYSYDESEATYESGIVTVTGSNAVASYSTSERNQGVNPRFNLSYQATENFLLYSTAAKGFRPGGGTGPVPTTGVVGSVCEANLQAAFGTTALVPSPASYGPDRVWSYEVGEKMSALERRVILNSGVYFENWGGVQQLVPLQCGYTFQANAGNAHVYGAEVELQAVLVPGLTLSANAGYMHARLATSNLLTVGINPGTPVQEIPEWTSSVGLAYEHGISDRLTFKARVENDYVGHRIDATYAINQLPAYDLTSARVGLEGGRWSAVLFASNVFNKRVLLNDVSQISLNLPTYNRITVAQPLTFGLDLSYRFGP